MFELLNWAGKTAAPIPVVSSGNATTTRPKIKVQVLQAREFRVRKERGLGPQNICLGATEPSSGRDRTETRDRPGDPGRVRLERKSSRTKLVVKKRPLMLWRVMCVPPLPATRHVGRLTPQLQRRSSCLRLRLRPLSPLLRNADQCLLTERYRIQDPCCTGSSDRPVPAQGHSSKQALCLGSDPRPPAGIAPRGLRRPSISSHGR